MRSETFQIQQHTYHYAALDRVLTKEQITRLPFCLRVLLENILRHQEQEPLAQACLPWFQSWGSTQSSVPYEIPFYPARVLLQDFTGVPAIVDLAAMRDAMQALQGDPSKINPLRPVELVIDHSVMVDAWAQKEALHENTRQEFARNQERYTFLRWGQASFNNFKVVPPNTGIVHQVNLEYLARVVFQEDHQGQTWVFPDSLVGTDSHTTMINGLGILAWGVGGIEAEAAMLGQGLGLAAPEVVGVHLSGTLPPEATATDLVLTLTERLRQHGVVDKFVEFTGAGLKHLSLPDRATIANMAPEFGATCAFFPIDEESLHYIRLCGRDEQQVELIETYVKQNHLFWHEESPIAHYSSMLHLDLGTVEPCIAGPKRPQDRIPLSQAHGAFQQAMRTWQLEGYAQGAQAPWDETTMLTHGHLAIAAITSCTNTSNPRVMLSAGLLARKAYERGLRVPAWVKTSLAPGSQVVSEYLKKAELYPALQGLGFDIVGYGCTTCIGNSGPLSPRVQEALKTAKLALCAVLSGNRNFEGRVHPDVKGAYLASPPLVIAYALAGTMNIDFATQPVGYDTQNQAVYLRDIWPSPEEVRALETQTLHASLFKESYRDVFAGPQAWQALPTASSEHYTWSGASTYIQHPPFFEGMTRTQPGLSTLQQGRVLALLGDSITTDHISPAGHIAPHSPAATYLKACGLEPKDFNSYGSRRGNHEVMMRGTFANTRLRNAMAQGQEGGWTYCHLSQRICSIYEAAMAYQAQQIPLVIFAGKEYGTGSSRDWAAKGTRMLGVRCVIAESFERIHRSNLIGMGVVPLEFVPGESWQSWQLDGSEHISIDLTQCTVGGTVEALIMRQDNREEKHQLKVRIHTQKELEYLHHGGILPYVLRSMLEETK